MRVSIRMNWLRIQICEREREISPTALPVASRWPRVTKPRSSAS
jgi:hypothetical protein